MDWYRLYLPPKFKIGQTLVYFLKNQCIRAETSQGQFSNASENYSKIECDTVLYSFCRRINMNPPPPPL